METDAVYEGDCVSSLPKLFTYFNITTRNAKGGCFQFEIWNTFLITCINNMMSCNKGPSYQLPVAAAWTNHDAHYF